MNRFRSFDSQQAAAMAVWGIVTGLISWLVLINDWPIIAEGLGAIFGLAVALNLYRGKNMPADRGFGVVAIFALSWVAAYHTALNTHDHWGSMALTGLVCGALGGAILSAGFAALFPRLRRPLPILAPVAAGASAGVLLGLPSDFGGLVFFVTWQGGVAASLGWSRNAFVVDVAGQAAI